MSIGKSRFIVSIQTFFIFHGFGRWFGCFGGSIRVAATVPAWVLPYGGYGRQESGGVGLPPTLEKKKGELRIKVLNTEGKVLLDIVE